MSGGEELDTFVRWGYCFHKMLEFFILFQKSVARERRETRNKDAETLLPNNCIFKLWKKRKFIFAGTDWTRAQWAGLSWFQANVWCALQKGKNASKRQMWHIKMPLNMKLFYIRCKLCYSLQILNGRGGAILDSTFLWQYHFYTQTHYTHSSGYVEALCWWLGIFLCACSNWTDRERASERLMIKPFERNVKRKIENCAMLFCLSHVTPFTWLLMNWILLFLKSFTHSILSCDSFVMPHASIFALNIWIIFFSLSLIQCHFPLHQFKLNSFKTQTTKHCTSIFFSSFYLCCQTCTLFRQIPCIIFQYVCALLFSMNVHTESTS